jgi:preprotein translocase subunit Sss1
VESDRWKVGGVLRNNAALALALTIAGLTAYSWLKAHDAWMRFQVESQLKDQQIAAREVQAATDRAAIEELKKKAQTPQQIVREIPKVIRLPLPPTESGVRTQESEKASDSGTPTPDSLPQAPQPQSEGIFFPSPDAKPLFDRLADCKAMESGLSACQQNFRDMKQERDLAVKARKGSFWQRAKQIGIGIAIGGAIGYAANR